MRKLRRRSRLSRVVKHLTFRLAQYPSVPFTVVYSPAPPQPPLNRED